MDFRREYLGQWISDTHSQRMVLDEREISDEATMLFDLWLDHVCVQEFRRIRLAGYWAPLGVSQQAEEISMDFWLCADAQQIPIETRRATIRGRDRFLMRPMNQEVVPLPDIDFSVENISARHSLQVKAHVYNTGFGAVLGAVRLEVEYVVPSFSWPDPPWWADHQSTVFNNMRVPDYAMTISEPKLPHKHKGFYVEKENQDRQQCFFCGEALMDVDGYKVCKECDNG